MDESQVDSERRRQIREQMKALKAELETCSKRPRDESVEAAVSRAMTPFIVELKEFRSELEMLKRQSLPCKKLKTDEQEEEDRQEQIAILKAQLASLSAKPAEVKLEALPAISTGTQSQDKRMNTKPPSFLRSLEEKALNNPQWGDKPVWNVYKKKPKSEKKEEKKSKGRRKKNAKQTKEFESDDEDSDEFAEILDGVAQAFVWDGAEMLPDCPALNARLVGSSIIFRAPPPEEFQLYTVERQYKNHPNKWNYELKFVVGDNAGHKQDVLLSKSAYNKSLASVSDWVVVQEPA